MRKFFTVILMILAFVKVFANAPLPAPATVPEAAQPTAPQNKFADIFPQIEDVTDKIGVGFWESNWYWVLLGIAILTILILILFRKKPVPQLSPFEIAERKINSAKENSDSMSAKEYASALSQAVRDYIEAVYNLPAPERTTQEFLKIAASSDTLDEKAQAILKEILSLADMAKFAQHSFKEDEKSKIADASINFIKYDDQKKSSVEKEKISQ